jgi:F0F1-type ATP synthase assembly protein I
MAPKRARLYDQSMKPIPTRPRELMIMSITMIVCCSVWLMVGNNKWFVGFFIGSGAVILARAIFLWLRHAEGS